jgi:thymidylate synthase (FAD)
MSNVELVWATPEAEKLIVKMARVSNPSNQENWETGPKLLKYCLDHKHFSIFEMCSLCIKIDTERDISAQILRHRSFSFQEFSTRYAKAQPLTVPELRKKDVKNRQNSTNDLDIHTQVYYDEKIRNQYADIEELYEEMIADGVAKECARRILPLSTQTTLYMHGTLRSFIHYIKVRTDASTQLEHRLIAIEIKKIFCNQFPIIGQAAFETDV